MKTFGKGVLLDMPYISWNRLIKVRNKGWYIYESYTILSHEYTPKYKILSMGNGTALKHSFLNIMVIDYATLEMTMYFWKWQCVVGNSNTWVGGA